MSTKSLRRKAVVAAIATAGGLAVPLLAAAPADAVAPTGLTVSPTSQNVAAGSAATLSVSLTGTNATNDNGVYFRIISGPDATQGNAGTACAGTAGGTTATCTFTGNTPGTDTFQVYYNSAGVTGGAYQAGDVATNATVTFVGPATSTTITPSTANVATNSSATYVVTGADVNGNAATGSVPVTISEAIPTTNPPSSNPLAFTNPSTTAFPAVAGGAGTNPVDGSTSTRYARTQTFAFTNGKATIGVTSALASTVSITAGTSSSTFSAGTASLAVSAGNSSATATTAQNDVASTLSLATTSGNAFTGRPITDVVTVKNAAGDPLGGVQVTGRVTGASANATVTPSAATTNQLGQVTLSYTASSNAGSDTLTAYVNQDTHTVNTSGPDSGEPQGTATFTIAAEPTNLTLTSNKDTNTATPTTQTATSVTYTLKSNGTALSGYTLNFGISTNSTPSGKGYTVTPTSGTTDANGQVTVTVTDPAPASADVIQVTASLSGDTTVADNSVVISYSTSNVSSLTLTPSAQTKAAGNTVTVTATVTDQFSQPVSGRVVNFAVSGRNGASANPNSTGSCTTASNGTCQFSYTDIGTAIPTGTTATDGVQASTVVPAANGNPATTTTANATVTYVPGNATTSSLTLTNSNATPATTTTGTNETFSATAKDSNGVVLAGKTVTFSLSGAGTFTDGTGTSLGSSTSAVTNGSGVATVNARSAQPGTQTVTASVEGQSQASTVTYVNAQFNPITPERVADTRDGTGGIVAASGAAVPSNGRLAANTAYTFNVSNTDLPQGASAYAFNITAISPSAAGNLRIAPGFSGAPATSLINYQPGKDTANFVVVPNTANGSFVIYSDGASTAVSLDAVGSYNGGVTSAGPTRVADTRTSGGTIASGSSRSFQVSGVGGIPANAKAVALNVTAISPSAGGNLRVYADGAALPTTSNINYIPGVTKAAFVIVNLPTDGKIDVYSDGAAVDVAVDAFAYYPSTSSLVTATPQRIFDSRTTSTLASGETRNVTVAGQAGVPTDAQAVLVSVTAIHTASSTGVGNLRVFPAGATLPTVSTLNYVSKTSDVANFAIVKLGTNGQISLYSDGSPINATVDVLGYVPAGS